MDLKANELRIGNYVEKRGQPISVNIEVLQKISDIRGAAGYVPIILTEKWLSDFGFEYADSFADDYTRQPISLYGNPFLEGWTVENLFNEQIKDNLLNIKYVHQLQNLYFSLTGTELVLPSAVGKV